MAVGIWDDPTNLYVPSSPTIRFPRDNVDEDIQTEQFSAPIYPYDPDYRCRLAKVDCLYHEFDGTEWLEVAVAFRYGLDSYTQQGIDTWDVRVMWTKFQYNANTHKWNTWGQWYSITGGDMAEANTGQTHPDLAYNSQTNDLYIAWTHIIPGQSVEVRYARSLYGTIYGGYHSLEAGNDFDTDFDGWYVSLDVGLVDGVGPSTERVVAFAYTGLFPHDSGWWDFRPLVGWWDVGSGPDDDDHPPLSMLVPFMPVNGPPAGNRYDAGLVKIDIPGDNAPDHGAAAVFVVDTCNPGTGTYQVYGISSLAYTGYTCIDEPGIGDIFDQATWPSLAIHNLTGNTASVSYFAKEDGQSDWVTYATYWTIDDVGNVIYPTFIDESAQGAFSLDVDDFMLHNWGTASSLANIGNNEYWAAWSDRMATANPHRVRGAFGWATDQ